MVLPDTSRCWAMKELARELLWNRRYDEHSRRLWQEWMAMAKNADIPLLSSAARTLRKRLYNAMKHRIKRKCRIAEQQDTIVADQIEGIPEQRTLQSGSDVPLRQAKYGVMSLP